MSRVFLDTNILAYASDKDAGAKREAARALLLDIAQKNDAVISTQVLQEFYVVATKKLGIPPLAAKELLASFHSMEVITITSNLIADAVDISILHRLSFWDGLILSAASFSRAEILYTEDLSSGSVIRGVKIVNPFSSEACP